MASVNYTSTQTEQIDQLKSYIEDYCSANGIDPAIYTSALDGETIDPAILSDPAFQAYWQLAYLQLMEIVNPALVQSVYAETGEIDFETVYAHAGDDMNEFIQTLVLDDPELLAFAARNGDDGGEALLDYIQDYVSSGGTSSLTTSGDSGSLEYTDEQARDLRRELGMGGMYDYLIGTQEGIRTTENYLMNSLAEMDQQLADLQTALNSGEITAEEFSAGVEQISAYRQVYVSMIQNLEDAWSNTLEMFSQLVKAQQEGQMSIARNLSGA